MQLNKPIGLFGGTFDPIHNGHLRLAQELYQYLDLSEVRFIPCNIPVFEKVTPATSEQRIAMLKLALTKQPNFKIELCEIERQGPSYTIDTLIHLREKFPNTPFCLFLGYDAFLSLPYWHRWQEILNYAHLILVPRDDILFLPEGELNELWAGHQISDAQLLHQKLQGYIYIAEINKLTISATYIRDQLSQGLSPRYLLPDAVLEFIQRESLYKM